MSMDGIVIANLVRDFDTVLTGARISRIIQPEDDELLLTASGKDGRVHLLLSADPSLPVAYITENTKSAPLTAPNFCMLLRKHLSGARILSVKQPGLERIIMIEFERYDELGELTRKQLIAELMGKHSNIILCGEDDIIIDSIKRISAQISSVREVLPGRKWFIPAQRGKTDPIITLPPPTDFADALRFKPTGCAKAIYSSFIGISPLIAHELCYRAGIDGDMPAASLSDDELLILFSHFERMINAVKERNFTPMMVRALSGGPVAEPAEASRDAGEPAEYASVTLSSWPESARFFFYSVSNLLETFYFERSAALRMRQKSANLRQLLHTLLERAKRKYELQQNQLSDTEKREKYKIYGEMIFTYGHQFAEGADHITVLNYYTGKELRVPLDPALSLSQNANRYYKRYDKLKRTYEDLSLRIRETQADILYLESVLASLDLASAEDDLVQIREELADGGYIRRRQSKKSRKSRADQRTVSRPYHYISSDGLDIYVGRNNYQNDELTLRASKGSDWWFHAKGIPGSHVLLKSGGGKIPDASFEEAARLAAYYSKGRGSSKVEIDYTQRKNIKKPKGAKPGFVIYHSNYSMSAAPDISGIRDGGSAPSDAGT